jgi:hypothetical protein
MNRTRVLKHWAKVAKVDLDKLTQPYPGRYDFLADEPELTTADMRRWILRECDRADYQFWMPHRIVGGAVVRVYYIWVGADPAPAYDLVLVVGGGLAELHQWADGKLVKSTPAQVEKNPQGKPSIGESIKIADYLANFKK